jgi:c-src tyrosine kinase
MFSFGLHPYSDMTNGDVIKHIESGGRLEYPENCPGEVCKIMECCWYEKPKSRPTFSQLYSIFANSPLLLGDLRAIRNKLVSETKISSTPLFDVFCGKFKEKSLAVKFLKDNCGKCWNLSMESSFMTSLNHPNLVQLVGVSLDQKPSYIITEFTEEGSLLEYLHTDPSAIDISKLVTFAEDICNAAAYLEEMGLAHTELAAKNILLSGEGVKVSNVESAIRSGCERDMFLPVKWTAPEALKSGIFTNKSDVWSFGVVLWEIYSFGRHPYPDLVSDPQVVLNHFEKGKKLEYPDDCPHDISEIMTSCWCTKPEDRPTFSEMQRDFTSLTSSQAV